MAEAYGDKGGWIYGNDYTQAWCTASVLSETPTTITYKVEGQLCLVNVYEYGMQLDLGYYYNGSSGDYEVTNTHYEYWSSMDNGWWPKTWVRSDITFTKGEKARTNTVFAWAHGATVDGYGPYPGSSEAKVTIDIPSSVTVPNNITNLKVTKNSETQATVTWTNNPTTTGPYDGVYVDREENDGEWTNVQRTNVTSYVDKTLKTNSRYRYRAIAYNNIGTANNNNHLYTGYIYTKPSTPEATAIKIGTKIVLEANVFSVRYAAGYEWQYSADGSSWTTISSNLSTTHTATVDSPKYRFRVKNSGGLWSSYVTPTVITFPLVFVNVPDDKKIKGVYVKDPWVRKKIYYYHINGQYQGVYTILRLPSSTMTLQQIKDKFENSIPSYHDRYGYLIKIKEDTQYLPLNDFTLRQIHNGSLSAAEIALYLKGGMMFTPHGPLFKSLEDLKSQKNPVQMSDILSNDEYYLGSLQ